MGQVFNSSNPILLLIACILTFIASYTALDLLTMLRTSKRNQKFLFLGSSFSMGTAVWTMNFFGILSFDHTGSTSYNISLTILSFVLGVALAAMGFLAVSADSISLRKVIECSMLLTMSVLSNYIIGMYSLNHNLTFHSGYLFISVLFIFSLFLFAFMLLYYSKHQKKGVNYWHKPLSAFIMTGSIAEGHFLLTRSLPAKEPIETINQLMNDTSFVVYLVFFVAICIVAGLIATSTIISKRLAKSDKYVFDITYALDQSSIVAITDEKGIITKVNKGFCDISKYSEEELIGKNHRIINSHYHSKDFFADLWSTIQNGEVWKGEIRNKAKDGSVYWVNTTIVPFRNGDGEVYQYLSIRNDITEQKEVENKLHQQDKLAAVGQLAAGVAHEIRNPLTSMKGYAEFLQLDEESEDRLEYLDIILDEIERVNLIVEEFMVLSKPQILNLENKNIVPILESVLSLVKFDSEERNIKILLEIDNEVSLVACDENRLKQVILNFVKNAMEAMPGGGVLTVILSHANDQVRLAIQDTGIGIPEDKLKKLGEPFFTTKKTGNGLGLMVSFKIIEGHNGNVLVDSVVNKGTTFTIVLPLISSSELISVGETKLG